MMRNTKKCSHGFSLLEVMIALVVLSIGLLGLGALQATSIRFNHGAYLRSQATILAYDITDRMRANKPGVESGDYDAIGAGLSASNPKCFNSGSGCTSAQMTTYDIWDWKTTAGTLLPGGDGTITLVPGSSPRQFTIAVNWNEIDNDAPNGVAVQSFSTQFQP